MDMQKEITLLKEMLGVDPKTIVGATEADEKAAVLTVKKTFETDMQQYAATLPPEKQHYRDALESIWQTNQELFTASTDCRTTTSSCKVQFTRREEERNKQIKEFRDKADEQAKDTVDQARQVRRRPQQGQCHERGPEHQAPQKDAEKDRSPTPLQAGAGLQGRNQDVVHRQHAEERKARKLQTSQFEVAQGEVVMVNPHKKGTVYLNLGSADQLIPLVTFSVHDAGANTALGDGLKARIEVTQILGDHISMCRVLEEDLANPIAEFDKVYTPLWHPGQRTHFGIFGNIDLDGDGEDDRELVRDMITSVGGVIDAEMDAQGKITGNIDINTRYLLEGKIPKDRNAVDGAALLISKAELAGTERMPMTKFIEQSGWKDPRQVVKFGRNGTREAHSFRPEGRGQEDRHVEGSGQLRQRKPWHPPQPAATDKD